MKALHDSGVEIPDYDYEKEKDHIRDNLSLAEHFEEGRQSAIKDKRKLGSFKAVATEAYLRVQSLRYYSNVIPMMQELNEARKGR